MQISSSLLLPVQLAAGAYLLGSIPSGLVVARLLKGPDPRGSGSGNIGATNVLRTLGAKAAILTLAGDLLKGILPVLAAHLLGEGTTLPALAGAAAILGHDFPLFLGFQGGKGVATTFGALLALDPLLAGILAAGWLIAVAVSRISSVGALAGAALAPPACLLLGREGSGLWFPAGAALLLVLRHRRNIGRLLAGTESRLGSPKPDPGPGSETGT